MNDLLPMKSRKDFVEKFGEELGGLGAKDTTVAHYGGGISTFDEYLSGAKFENTRCTHFVFAHENGILLLLLPDGEGSAKVNIWKDEIESVVGYHNQNINIADRSSFIKLINSGAAGLLWSGVGAITENIYKRLKPVNSKTVIGSVYEFRLKTREGGNVVFKITCEKENKHIVSNFFDKYLNTHLSTPDDKRIGCYIATVCYSDPYSYKVIDFRNFRDNVLKKYVLGKTLIKMYYKYSPRVADYMYSRKKLNSFTRFLLDIIHKIIK